MSESTPDPLFAYASSRPIAGDGRRKRQEFDDVIEGDGFRPFVDGLPLAG
jgi:hypothetical protein